MAPLGITSPTVDGGDRAGRGRCALSIHRRTVWGRRCRGRSTGDRTPRWAAAARPTVPRRSDHRSCASPRVDGLCLKCFGQGATPVLRYVRDIRDIAGHACRGWGFGIRDMSATRIARSVHGEIVEGEVVILMSRLL